MVFMYQGQSLSGGGSGADENVKQVPTSSGSNYEVLFSGGANNTEETNYSRKTNAFKYSPDTQSINLGFTANNGNTGISLDGLTGSIKSNLNSTEFVEIGQYGHANAVFYKYVDGVAYNLAIDSSDISISQGPLWDGETTSLKNALKLTAKKSNITDEYDSFTTYAVGDYCIYENTLYVCNTAITTPESFDSTHWTATNIDSEFDDINSRVNNTYDAGRGLALHFATVNYDTTLTFNAHAGGNGAGLIIVGGGSNVSLWAFSFRASTPRISIYKVGGDNTLTLTAAITTAGKVTITSSGSIQMMAIYSGTKSS